MENHRRNAENLWEVYSQTHGANNRGASKTAQSQVARR